MEISFGISAPNNTMATDYVEIYGRFFAWTMPNTKQLIMRIYNEVAVEKACHCRILS